MNLGINIKKLRESKGYSQEMVAEKLEVSRQAVSKWENNLSEPSTENLMKLSKLFDIEVDLLINGKGEVLADHLKNENRKYYYNETKTKLISYILLLLFFPLNIYFYNKGIYGEVYIELGFMGKQFLKDSLYDIPFWILTIGLLVKFIKDIKNKENTVVLVTKKDKIISWLTFSFVSLILILVYFLAPEFTSIACFLGMIALVFITLVEVLREITKKEF